MNLIFRSVNLKKIDIDFLRQKPERETKSQMAIERLKALDESKETKVLLVNSTYSFPVKGGEHFFVFEAVFEILDLSNSNELEKVELDKIVELILLPQEMTIVRDILAKFGANVKEGLPLGAEFNV